MWRDLQFKTFVDFASAGKYHGLTIICIRQKLVSSKHTWQDVELQSTQIVVFKSVRDVMQVSTLCGQMGLGSQLVDRYQDATFVPYGHELIELSSRTDDRLCYYKHRKLSLKV